MSKRICPDCKVKPGENHTSYCDIETCPECGEQRMSCDCHSTLPPIPWSGEHVLYEAAREHDFYCYQDSSGWGKPEMHYGHIPCSKDHPEAAPDLNRVSRDCMWDKDQRKWVLK